MSHSVAIESINWICSKCGDVICRDTPTHTNEQEQYVTFNDKGNYFCKCTTIPVTKIFPLYWRVNKKA